MSYFLRGFDLSFLDPKAPPDVSAVPKDAEMASSAWLNLNESKKHLAQGGLASKLLLRPTCALSKSIPLTPPGLCVIFHASKPCSQQLCWTL